MADLEALVPRDTCNLVPGVTGADLSRLRGYLEAGIAPRTRKAYQATIAAWESWTSERGLPAFPPEAPAVALWLSSMAGDGLKPATIARHVAALGTLARFQNWPVPSSSPEVRATLRGIRRKHGIAPEQAAPFLLSDLVAGLPRGDAPRAVRDRALLLLGWAGALRRSEVSALNVADLEARNEGFALKIRTSKTDQESEGAIVGIPRGRAPGRCPVVALQAWIACLPEPSGALFRSVNRHGRIGMRISDRAVSTLIQEAAERAGLPRDRFSGHSLRAGFATEAASAGISERAIMRHTRHKSVTVARGYIRKGSIFLDNPAVSLL